jgi:uncharacterized protein
MTESIKMDENLYRSFLAAINPNHLELRLFATEKCNFRCVYCYEDFELGRMEKWVRDGIKNLMAQRCATGLRSLYVSWFGGEPLMALEVIEDIEAYRQILRQQYPDLLLARSGITTNGYLLTPDVLSKLVGLGVQEYQITLDGSPTFHNTTRLRADGAGTFAQIYDNLLAASKTDLDFGVDIRMHLHSANIDDVRNTLTARLIQDFAHDTRFRLHPISIGNYGGAFEKNPIKTTTRQLADESRAQILKQFADARSGHTVPVTLAQPTTANPITTSEGAAEVCYAAASNSFAIRANGTLIKCTTALDDPRNNIGTIKPTGELDIDPDLVKMWMGGFLSGNKGELACPLHKVKKLPVPAGKRVIPIGVAA